MRSHYTKVSRNFLFTKDSEGNLKSNYPLKMDGLNEDIPKGSKIPYDKDFHILHNVSSRHFHVQKLSGDLGYNIVRALK